MVPRAPALTMLRFFCVAFALVAAACSPRTVSVTLPDEGAGPVKVPDPSTPVTALAFCTAARVDVCSALAGRASEMRTAGVTLVLVGVSERDNVFMTHPIAPEVVARLRAKGALYGTDHGAVARNWLGVERDGGAVIDRDGTIVFRATGDALVDKAMERARTRGFIDALPGPATIVIALVALLVLGAIVVAIIVKPRPFARTPIAIGAPFAIQAKARRKRTALWVKDDLSLASGQVFDSDHWPEGLGMHLDLRVAIDGRVVFDEHVVIGDHGPGAMAFAVYSNGTSHSATKLLFRFDTRPGAVIEVSGTMRPMPLTTVNRAEVLVA